MAIRNPSEKPLQFSAQIESVEKKGQLRLSIKDEASQTTSIRAKYITKSNETHPILKRINTIILNLFWKKIYLPTGEKVLINKRSLSKRYKPKKKTSSEYVRLFFEYNKLISTLGKAGYANEALTIVNNLKKHMDEIKPGNSYNIHISKSGPITAKFNKDDNDIILSIKSLGDGHFKSISLKAKVSDGKALAHMEPASFKDHLISAPSEEYERLQQYQGCDYIIKSYLIGGEYYLEYMNKGSLEREELREDLQNPNIRLQLMIDACKGVKYVHERNKVHNDISLQNILVKEVWSEGKLNLRAKIADFDLQSSDNEWTELRRGRRQPPEKERSLNDPSYVQKKADDIWALGVVLYEMKNGGLDLDFDQSRWAKLEEFRKEEPKKGTEDHIIWSCLQENPNERPSIDKLLDMLESLQKNSVTGS